MSGLNSNYISSLELQSYFVDKANAEALAGGFVYFFRDSNRTTPKTVYELVQGAGSPPNYSYVALPNPLQLSGVGTFMDSNGNDIAVYYYPFDAFGNQDLYYIEVWNAQGKPNGQQQFTRDAWPFPASGGGGSGGSSAQAANTNHLTNPQFTTVNFNTNFTYTITSAGAGSQSITIAPGWVINVTFVGAGSLTVAQSPINGSSALPFNPPYVLTVTPGANISVLNLAQQLPNNPDWAAPQTSGVMGYLSGSILLGNGTSVIMQYKPSAGNSAQTIINTTNTTGAYNQVSNTIQLQPADNPNNGNVGFDQIILNLSTTIASQISNVQVCPLTTNISGVEYEQTPVNRQIDHMFNYYNPLLQAKPLRSYLVGWDFPLNPAQALGWTQSAQTLGGANLSRYILDQTILFTSVDDSISIAQSTGGELVLTATADTQIALIQYLDGQIVNDILTNDLSSIITGFTSQTSGISASASLWYGNSVPSIVSPTCQSLVATLDSSGKPATLHGSWTEVYRSGIGGGSSSSSLLGNAKFTLARSTTHTLSNYPFSGWSQVQTASNVGHSYFAYVLGFSTLSSGESVTLRSISLIPGNIPTIPGATTQTEEDLACYRYYESSFPRGTLPAQALGLSTNPTWYSAIITTSTTNQFYIPYKAPKRTSLNTITFYNPVNANAQVYDAAINVTADCSNTQVGPSGQANNMNSQYGFVCCYQLATAGSPSVADICAIHWTCDARIGVI